MSLSRNLLLIILCAVLVAGVPFLLFQDVLDYDFLNYDDDIYVTGNPVVHSLHYRHIWAMVSQGYFRSYQPLTLLSHALDYVVWGPQARGHHLTNLLLHAANSLLLMALLLLFLRRHHMPDSLGRPKDSPVRWWIPIVASATAALLFAVHPLRVESVAWVSDRKDLVMTFFLIPSCIAYLMARTEAGARSRTRWYRASVALFVSAVLAKTVAVALPVGLLLLDLHLVARERWQAELPGLLRLKIPYLVCALGLGLVAVLVGGGHTMSRLVRDLSLLEQLLVPAFTIVAYLARTVIPVGLTPVYSAPTLPVLLGANVAGMVLLWWLLRHRERRAVRASLLAGAAFASFVLPTMVGIVAKSGIQPWADRYVYFASVPLVLLLGGGIAVYLHRSTAAAHRSFRLGAGAAVVALALVFSVALGHAYMPVWRASEPLWHAVIASSPELSYGYNNLGTVLLGRGESQRALAFYRTAQDRDPSAPGPWYNMGLAYADLGAPDSATVYFRAALGRDSSFVDAYTALGTLALSHGDVQGAMRHYEQALLHEPGSAKAHHNIGMIYYKEGKLANAERHFALAVASEPFSTRAILSLAVVSRETGNPAEARRLFRRAARLGSPEARQLLAAENDTW